jgi:ABC-type branched-subunit amino acid transport system ATPase component/predicted MFS family arabinose efflux permease
MERDIEVGASPARGTNGDRDEGVVQSLASTIVRGEEQRRAEQAEREDPSAAAALEDTPPLSFWQAVRAGGWSTLAVCTLLVLSEELDRTAIAVLAPDIQRTLDISDTTLIGIVAFSGVVLVLGALPLAWLADRMSRVRILQGFAALGAVSVGLAALVANPFLLFWSRAAVGFSNSYRLPVHNSLLADTYPVQARARIFGVEGLGRPMGLLLGPLMAGSIAAWAGGEEGWRWAFVAASIPVFVLFVWSLRLREPKRGGWEQQLVLGTQLEHQDDLRISMGAAFERLKKIKTFYFLCAGIGVLGFALVAVPVQLSLLLESEYGYGAYTRGWVMSITWAASIVSIPLAGVWFDRLFRRSPALLLRASGAFIIAYGITMLVALQFNQPAALIGFISVANAFTSAAFVSVGPIVAAVAPSRMRAQAFALVPIFIFLMGGFFGGLLAGSLSDSFGQRTALIAVSPAAGVIGGSIVLYGSRFVRRDIARAVEEIREERSEMERRAGERGAATPRLQVRNLDVSYGTVQILFGVEFDVAPGEVLALLGTNGAGKSTVLRAISGLTLPDRGVIRLDGRTITYADAEVRTREGIVQVRGGSGTFGELTVEENLLAAMLTLGRHEPRSAITRRLDETYDTFPALDVLRKIPARSLSGGQQQMLALGMALTRDPSVLLIDELSLGLAPVVVQDLLAVVERLRARGVTMVIVEQSLNVAVALADRAVFLEKGHVRFIGPARELLERGDLARAVFLGETGTSA